MSGPAAATTPDTAAPGSRDRADVWVRSGYWWAFGAIGALTPFITLYYRELGLAGLQVGVLAALPAVGVAVFGPVWGALADANSNHRLVLRASLVVSALLALGLAGVSSFVPILLLAGSLAFFAAPAGALLDSYGLTIAERRGRSYGSLRVWGSLGYTAAVFVVGRLMGDRVSPLFLVAYAVCLALACASTLGLPGIGERSARPLVAGFGVLLRNRSLLVLLSTTYLISSSASVMYSFLGIHLAEMGGTAGLIGLAFALNAASELPIVAFGGWFLARLGAVRLLALAVVVYVFRMAAYSVLPAPEWVLPIQALHGLSYGAFLMASVTLAHRLAGRERAATAQALLASMSFGFGSITGAVLGGALLDRIDTVGIFRVAAAAMVVALGVWLVGARSAGIREASAEPAAA